MILGIYYAHKAPLILFPSAPITYELPIVLTYTNKLLASLHVSRSPYGFHILQPSVQLPSDPQQRFGRI